MRIGHRKEKSGGERTTEQRGVGNGSTGGMGAALVLPVGFPGAGVGVGVLIPHMGGDEVGMGMGKRMGGGDGDGKEDGMRMGMGK